MSTPSMVTGAIGICAALFIIFLVRRDRLQAGQAVRWMIVAAGFALLGLAPSLNDQLARALGIAYPPVLALSIAIVVLVVKILIMDMERARMLVRHERLVQRLAILEASLAQLQDQPASDAAGGAATADADEAAPD